MRSFLSLALLALTTVVPSALAGPIGKAAGPPVVVTPGPPQNARITKDNTLNGTYSNALIPPHPEMLNLPIGITNNFNGGQLYAYITGLDPQNRVVMLQSNGQWYYPTSSSCSVPQPITANVKLTVGGKGTTRTFTLPTYLSSGRVYLSEGEITFSSLQCGNSVTLVQPDFNNPSDSSAGKNWGFVELTNLSNGIWANLSYVDFVGLPLGMSLTDTNGQTTTVRGVNSGAVSTMCSGLRNYADPDGAPWDQLCQYLSNGTPLRAVSPQKYIPVHSGAFSNYYTNYVNSVWSKYSSQPLTINPQNGGANFQCTTSGNNMNCAGGSRPFTKPSAVEIFGCQGTFGGQQGDNGVVLAATARLCAAFHRTTYLLNGGNVQPSLGASNYYLNAPTNRYAKLVHQVELDGRGYAFPYDDVNPNTGADQSGLLSVGNPQSLTITVGGA